MTKEEAVKKIAREGYISIEHAEELYDSIVPKPVVPKYVVDWVVKSRELNYLFIEWFYALNQPDEVFKWLHCKNKRQAELNALALVTLIVNGRDAVTVEEEKRYTVRVKGLSNKNVYLKSNLFRNFWYIEEDDFGCEGISHTRKELEDADFGWVFSCEGFEVKEVE